MAGVWTSDQVVEQRLGFHNVERDGHMDSSMNAFRDIRLQMDPRHEHVGHESVAARASRLRRAAEDRGDRDATDFACEHCSGTGA